MYCSQCGKAYSEKVNFCSDCGTAMVTPGIGKNLFGNKKLARSRHNRKIAGVCGGFAEYLEIDATLVRLVWLMLLMLGGSGLVGYLAAWIVMPEAREPVTASALPSSPQFAGNH